MKKMQKFLALAMCAAMVTASLTGCGKKDDGGQTTQGTTAPASTEGTTKATEGTTAATEGTTEGTTQAANNEPVHLRIWAHWGSEQRRPTINKMVDAFNEMYKDQNITAEYVYVPYDDIETKMMASVTAGNPGNVVITAIEKVGVKAMRNQAMDITEYLTPGIQDQYYDTYMKMVTWNDKIYSLPFNTETRFIFYNKEMFAEAGINADEIKTWDDMYNATVKLDEKFMGTGSYILGYNPLLGNMGFSSLLINNGGKMWDDNYNPQTPTFNSKECVETLEYMKRYADLYGADLIQTASAANAGGAQDLFLGRKVAMIGNMCNYIATIAQYNGEAQVDYGVFEAPVGPSNTTGHGGAWGGGFVCTVPYGAENPKESTLLAEFMTTEGAKIWGQEQLDVMCCIEANENPAMAQYVGWEETLAIMPYTQGTRANIYAPAAGGYVDQKVDAICKNFTESDVQAALDAAQAEAVKKIEEEKFIFGE